MRAVIDAFWRAAVHCLSPRVLLLSLLPLAAIGALALVLGVAWWQDAVNALAAMLRSAAWLGGLWRWIDGIQASWLQSWIGPFVLLLAAVPAMVVVCLLIVALCMTPALGRMVVQRRFPHLARRGTASFVASLGWSLGSTALALAALLLSLPLWFIPPLALVLPPLIWGWLTYRVMAFDALATHADEAERRELFRRHRSRLLLMGIVCGYLGAAPSIVWASGLLFAAAFVVLLPLALWIYTLVFAFSALWFLHYGLAALVALRAEAGGATRAVTTPAPSKR